MITTKRACDCDMPGPAPILTPEQVNALDEILRRNQAALDKLLADLDDPNHPVNKLLAGMRAPDLAAHDLAAPPVSPKS